MSQAGIAGLTHRDHVECGVELAVTTGVEAVALTIAAGGWELRNRLTRSAARMHANHVDPMVDDLHALGRLGADILAAWNAKEDLLDLLALARTQPDRRTVAERLYRFYARCAKAGLPELEGLATTIETWWPEILAFIHTGITNAGSEGTNRVIKAIARDASGFRNPENQRLRTRCATTRRTRGHLNPA